MNKTRVADLFRVIRRAFRSDQSGATAVEYGLMVALIAAVIIASTAALGSKTKDCFTTVKGAMDAPATATAIKC